MSKKHQTKNRPHSPAKKHVGLRAAPTAFSDRTLDVDVEGGVIKNVALMTVGPALGHGFEIDQMTIEQLVALANQQPEGVKSRFKHPEITTGKDAQGNAIQTVADDTGTMVGRIKNVRIVGDQARGDVYLGDYAKNVPGLGDVRGYLLSFAKDDPAGIGMSAMFSFDVEPVLDQFDNVIACPARISELDAIDFVGQPAANPRGLLSARAATFDPQPPSGAPDSSGWADPKPADPAAAPIPVSTPEFPHDARGQYLGAIVQDGPLHLGGLAARFTGRLEAMRAGAEWLVGNGYADKDPRGQYKATPKGVTAMAAIGVWRKSK